MTPILYYDRIRIGKADIDGIVDQSENSTFHDFVATAYQTLRTELGNDVLIIDRGMPVKGRSESLSTEVKSTSNIIIEAAGAWSPSSRTLVRPGEVKGVLIMAYREWIRYNRRKVSLLPENDPLRAELLEKQIPRWSGVLRDVKATKAAEISETLLKSKDLRQVFDDIIRNALLLSTTPKPDERVFDSLVEEFLPALELVERVRLWQAIQDHENESMRYDLILKLHQIRLSKLASLASNRPDQPRSVVLQAIRERSRFAILRKRLSELDEAIKSLNADEFSWLTESLKLTKEVKKEIDRVEKAGTAFMWLSGAYFLAEVLSGVDPSVGKAVRMLLVNPITTKKVKDIMKNLYLADKGFGQGAPAAIAVTRDYLAMQRISQSSRRARPAVKYEFWI